MKDELKLNFSIVLVQPQTAGNIGAIARVCKNFSVNKLVLVNPEANHLSDEAMARAMHSHEYLEEAVIFQSMKKLRNQYQILIATSAKSGRNYHISRQPSYPWELSQSLFNKEEVAFVFGREDKGLFNHELQLCDFLVTIPLTGQHIVLNLSHAVALIIYECWRSLYIEQNQLSNEEMIAESKARNVLFSTFDEIVESLQYETYRKPIIKQAFKFLINRSFVRPEETHSFIGVFNRILRALNTGSDKNETKEH